MAEPVQPIPETRRQKRARAAKERMPEYADDPYAVAFPDIAGQEGSTWEEISDYRKALRQARMGAVAGFVPGRLQAAAQGATGIFPTGVSWQEQGEMRQALIEALRAKEQADNELKAQGLRHSYQTRTAEAQELNALGRIIQQGLQSSASSSARNAEISLYKAQHAQKFLDTEIAERGMQFGRYLENVDADIVNNMGTHLAPLQGNLKPEDVGKRRWEADAGEAQKFHALFASGITGDPKQDAAYLEKIEATHQIDIGSIYGVRIAEVTDEETGQVSWRPTAVSKKDIPIFLQTEIGTLERPIRNAQIQRAKMRNADTKYLQRSEQAYDDLQQAYAGIPGPIRPIYDRFIELMGRKQIPPNTQTRFDENGKLVPDPEQPAPPAGVATTEEAQTQTQTMQPEQEPSRDLFKEQIQEQIEHLDNPNPPGKVLQAKNDIIDSALFQAFKQNEEFETDDVAYRAFMEESRDRDREAKAKDTEKLQQRRMKREGGEGNLRTRMAEGFAKLRPRYRRRRLAAETASETPADNPSGSETNAKEDIPAEDK